MSAEGLKASVEKMRREGVPDAAMATFSHYYEQLEAGESGMIPEDSIEPVRDLPDSEQLPDRDAPLDRAVVIKLNGGLGTSMGMDRAKSLLEVKDGLAFLDVIARQVLALRGSGGARVPLVLMNSFYTREDSLALLERYEDLASDVPFDFVQHKEPKLRVDLDALDRLLRERDGVVGLPMIVNEKTVDPSDSSSPPVYQLETAMGAAIGVFEGARAIRVPRSRFVPVKKTSDLLVLRSDAYALGDGARIELARGRSSPPLVELDDEHFKLLGDFEARFPAGPPSLAEADRLEVVGDVRFGRGVTVRGRVRVEGPREIEDGAELAG